MNFCATVPEICRGQVHVPKKERKEEKNNNKKKKKKRSKNHKSPNVVWETYLRFFSLFQAKETLDDLGYPVWAIWLYCSQNLKFVGFPYPPPLQVKWSFP